MLPALIIFLLTYLLMLALPQYRPFAALGGAALFLALGAAGLWDFTLMDAARAVDFNVLLMMAGTMGTVSLFIESRMPARLAELLIVRVPNVKWAVCMLALFAGVISAFVDNVATVLMVAPVGLAIARKLRISPVPVLISIAVSSNLQGAATLVGDTTSILLGGFAGMNFFHFFWMEGRPGIFFGVELGALASLGVLLFTFRHETQPISATVETEVTDTVPSALMLLTVGLLIAASFLPQPAGGLPLALYGLRSGLICAGVCLFTFRHETQPISATVETEVTDTVPSALMLLTVGLLIAASFLPQPAGGLPLALYGLRSGLICAGVCLFGILRACLRRRSFAPFRLAARELDCDTLLLLFGLFILIEGIRKAGVIDAAAQLFYTLSGDDPFRLYTLLVFVSVGLSAFIDNIPYVATMLPVVQGIAGLMNGGAGFPPELFYFGLLTGATLGGNLTPIGASANIAAIGILRKQGEQVRTRDFLRIGIPFTLAAVLTGYVYLWLVWGA